MKDVHLGRILKEIRKKELSITQKAFSDSTGIEIKKLSRIETGYQLPDEQYFEALKNLKISNEKIEEIRSQTDDSRRELVIKRQGLHPASETMIAEIEYIKEVVAMNNLLLRKIWDRLNQKPSTGSLFDEALKPIDP